MGRDARYKAWLVVCGNVVCWRRLLGAGGGARRGVAWRAGHLLHRLVPSAAVLLSTLGRKGDAASR
jgi:hypothetical protein